MLKRRTIIISAIMKWFMVLFMLGLVGLAAYFAIDRSWMAETLAREYPGTDVTPPVGLRFWLWWLLISISIGIAILILYNMYRLFDAFHRRDVLSPRMARSVRGIGFWMIVAALMRIVSVVLSGLIVTWANGPGERTVQIMVNNETLMIAAFGIMMLLMGIAIDEALRLDEENRQIV